MVATLTSASPTSAQVNPEPTTSWGVTGFESGTERIWITSPVLAMERVGDVLFVGGRFTHVTNGRTNTGQSNLAAFDAITGEWIKSFRPQLNGWVYGLASDGDRLFVGGSFSQVNRTQTGGLAALDLTTGDLDRTWKGHVGRAGRVGGLLIDDGYLYAGGGFRWMGGPDGGAAAWRLGRFDLRSGRPDSDWRPVVGDGTVRGMDIDKSRGRLYLTGDFTKVGNQSAPVGFASVELSTGNRTAQVANLGPNAVGRRYQQSFDVLTVGDRVFVAGGQHALHVLDADSLELDTFYLSMHQGDYQTLTLVDGVVYAGCHCNPSTKLALSNQVRWWGPLPTGVSQPATTTLGPNTWVGAFDARSGERLDFAPPITSGGAGIWASTGDGTGCVWFGGAITSVGGTDQHSMTRFCPGGAAAPDRERPLPPGRLRNVTVDDNSFRASWRAATDNVGVAGYRIFDAATGKVVLETSNTSGTVSGLAPGSYRFYVKAFDAAGNQSWRSALSTVKIAAGPGPVDRERPTPPGAARIAANDGAGTFRLTWNASTDNVGVVGYRIIDSATGTVLAETAGPSTSLTVRATTRVHVRAFDSAGNQSWRSGHRVLNVG